jgi:hypothetical protein
VWEGTSVCVTVGEDVDSGDGVCEVVGDNVAVGNLVAVEVGFEKPQDSDISVMIITIKSKLDLIGFFIDNQSIIT